MAGDVHDSPTNEVSWMPLRRGMISPTDSRTPVCTSLRDVQHCLDFLPGQVLRSGRAMAAAAAAAEGVGVELGLASVLARGMAVVR